MSSFYVYEWFIVDTLEVFYVGKGTGNRRFETHNRNIYFKNVYNKHKCAVRVIAQSLTNDEAFTIEQDRIYELKAKGLAKCNLTLGGKGWSTGELNPTARNPHFGEKNGMHTQNIDFSGKNNPFYGKRHTEETKKRISTSRKGKGARHGKDNPMFGNGHLVAGENNGMYGVRGFDHPNSRMYKVEYTDGTSETLTYKQCERKFGIAFTRVSNDGGVLHYKKKSKNSIYEGTKLTKLT
jgi:hypothetical protein